MNNLVKLSAIAVAASLMVACSEEDAAETAMVSNGAKAGAAAVASTASVADRLAALEKSVTAAKKSADQAAADAKKALASQSSSAGAMTRPSMGKGGMMKGSTAAHNGSSSTLQERLTNRAANKAEQRANKAIDQAAQ
jgi:hypothetical protein